jgi:small subunit ribosomal protein S8
MNDPIADFLTRIRNAGQAKHTVLNMPSSKAKVELSRIFQKEGYIEAYEVVDAGNNKKELKLTLKYHKSNFVIEGMKRISKGSCRIYVRADEIPSVRGGLGISIVTTSQGMMTGKEARVKGIGGELICKVW